MSTKIRKKQLSQEITDEMKANQNVIESISINGKVINPDPSKNVEVPIPTSLPASDVYDWAKQPQKPSYTASEVGADPSGSAENVKEYTDQKFEELIGTSPENLDTIYELAQAILDNQDVVQSINDAVTNKVDKIPGKGLSEVDVTNQMVQTWNNKSDFSGSYNDLTDKPDIGTGGQIELDTAMSDTSENAVQNKIIKAYVDGSVDKFESQSDVEGTPVGHILTHMGTKAPKHYLICDGSIYNVGQYPYLEQHFVEDFGSVNFFGGDGVTTFAVPDLRGEFLRGTGTAIRDSGSGAEVGEHQDGTKNPYIGSSIEVGGASIWTQTGNKDVGTVVLSPENIDMVIGGGNNDQRYWEQTGKTASGAGYMHYTSRPTNTSVLYCIKYEPTYAIKTPEVNYSYEERRIGTWVDGKPLYEKTVHFGSMAVSNQITKSHNVQNADSIWIFDGFVYYPVNQSYTRLSNSYYKGLEYQWSFIVDRTNIINYVGQDRSGFIATVTLRYTKTTDQPTS